jgi:hypothetical protein
VVVSSDGSEDMEAIVAALLNIHVDSDGKESNALNRAICGHRSRLYLPKKADEQALILQNVNLDIEMIICVHCNKKIRINYVSGNVFNGHPCPASNLKRTAGAHAVVYARLFTQMKWCPNKACAIIDPRPYCYFGRSFRRTDFIAEFHLEKRTSAIFINYV